VSGERILCPNGADRLPNDDARGHGQSENSRQASPIVLFGVLFEARQGLGVLASGPQVRDRPTQSSLASAGNCGPSAGKLAPLAAAEFAPARLWSASAPLLEEERHSVTHALIANGLRPRRIHRSAHGTTLTSDNDPMNTVEIESERSEQGFAR